MKVAFFRLVVILFVICGLWVFVPVNVTLAELREHPKLYFWRVIKIQGFLAFSRHGAWIDTKCKLQQPILNISGYVADIAPFRVGLISYLAGARYGSWTGVWITATGRLIPEKDYLLGKLDVLQPVKMVRLDDIRDYECNPIILPPHSKIGIHDHTGLQK